MYTVYSAYQIISKRLTHIFLKVFSNFRFLILTHEEIEVLNDKFNDENDNEQCVWYW